ncbi:MAG: hypothetical protein ACREQ5_16160 [Candidatus Dormibacteria bacterium]
MSGPIQSDSLGGCSWAGFTAVASIGAGVANTVVQATFISPWQFKIRKVAVNLTAIDNVAGTDSFNIVIGYGAYAQNNPVPNDNSYDQAAPGGFGYPTNVGIVGQSVFGKDVAFSSANIPGITTANGGFTVMVPANYDAVYPAGVPLTVRATTVITTGSISNLLIVMGVVPMKLRLAPPATEGVFPQPGVDY